MITFGSVTHKNLKGDLRNVANVAQSSQNQNVRVQVLRDGKVDIQLSYLKIELAIQLASNNVRIKFNLHFYLRF